MLEISIEMWPYKLYEGHTGKNLIKCTWCNKILLHTKNLNT